MYTPLNETADEVALETRPIFQLLESMEGWSSEERDHLHRALGFVLQWSSRQISGTSVRYTEADQPRWFPGRWTTVQEPDRRYRKLSVDIDLFTLWCMAVERELLPRYRNFRRSVFKNLTIHGKEVSEGKEDPLFIELEVPGGNEIFHGARLQGAVLDRVYWTELSFQGAKLQDASIVYSCLDGGKFEDADLRRVNGYQASLAGCIFRNTRMDDSRFRCANLTSTQFLGGVNLNYADFLGANLEGCRTEGSIWDKDLRINPEARRILFPQG